MKFTFKTVAIVLVGVYAAVTTGVIASQAANAETTERPTITIGNPVNAARVEALLVRYVNGRDARKSDLAVVNYVLDSTNDAALEEPCGFNRFGNEISKEGDQAEAQMVGDVMYAHSPKEKAAYQRKLSKHMGFCYLAVTTDVGGVTHVNAARSGAVKRIALALSKMTGEPVAIVDGTRRTTYNW